MYQMFPVHTSPEKFENAKLPVILDLCLRKTLAGKSRDYRDVIVFENLRFQNVLRPHKSAQPTFLNYSGEKSFFEKLRFLDGLVWTVGLTVEIKLHFQNPPSKFMWTASELPSACSTFSSPSCLHTLYDFY